MDKKKIIIIGSCIALAVLTAIVALVFAFGLGDETDPTPEEPTVNGEQSQGVTLAYRVLLLQADESVNLQANGKNLQYTSADPSVATVDAEGNVTGVKVGETVITCSDGKNKATCTVLVNRSGAPKESFTAPTGNELTLAASKSGGYCGEYASVTLYLCNNSGIAGFSATVSYDSDAFVLKAVDAAGVGVDSLEYEDNGKGSVQIAGLSHSGNTISDQTGKGALVRLYFAIKSDASKGSKEIGLTLAEGDMLVAVKDDKEVTVTPKLAFGSIEVK